MIPQKIEISYALNTFNPSLLLSQNNSSFVKAGYIAFNDN